MKRIVWALVLAMCLTAAGCQKEPAKIAVEAVTLNPTSISLTEGESAEISATVSPSNATNQGVVWATSDASVATVKNGLVKAISSGSATVTVTSDDGGKTATCEVTVMATVIDVTGVSLDKATLNLEAGSTGTLTATVEPSNATNMSVIWSSDNEAVATVSEEGVVRAFKAGKATVTVTTADQGMTATCAITVTEVVPLAVDLGLSVKWASFNLGATKPEEYGGYYQWAGTEDVSDTSIYLDLSNCPYHTGLDDIDNWGWTKYVPSNMLPYWSGSTSPDNKTVLDPEDDAAHANLGGKWRIPTKAEWSELKNTSNCSWTWITVNGVDGFKVTSKKSGYTDNYIFLPVAGSRYEDFFEVVGAYGYYWYSTVYSNNPDRAYCLFIDSISVEKTTAGRCMGISVRPVSE